MMIKCTLVGFYVIWKYNNRRLKWNRRMVHFQDSPVPHWVDVCHWVFMVLELHFAPNAQLRGSDGLS